jgi:A/G-specific adenine glycosylase
LKKPSSISKSAKPTRIEKAQSQSSSMPEPELAKVLSEQLIAWFEKNKRQLPWRGEKRDPYAVWVSEVMLQQTRVSTVIPYFQRFIDRFPSVQSLGTSSLDEVLSLWSGLGYYRRARALHQGALFVAESLRGQMPPTHALLKQLPGVGDYTAAAIASLAYGEAVAVVDGNVRRVLARVFAMTEPSDSPAMKRSYDAIANSIIPPSDPARFNEAMMELGALVCTPKSPNCAQCPLKNLCEATKQGIAEQLPVLAKKGPIPTVHLTMVRIEFEGKILLGRRRAKGLFGGLWEPICIESESASAVEADTRLRKMTGAQAKQVGSFRHVLTHRILEVNVAEIRLNDEEKAKFDAARIGSQTYDQVSYFDRNEIEKLGISTLARKALRLG